MNLVVPIAVLGCGLTTLIGMIVLAELLRKQ